MDKSTSFTTSHIESTDMRTADMRTADMKAAELGHIVSVARVDRWSINLRLQELNIPCTCPADGTLRVNVNHAVALLLVNSVVRRVTLPRQTNVDWLERCWGSHVACSAAS